MYIDSTYIILVLPTVIFAMIAQYKVKSTFKKYSNVKTNRSITGKEVAERLMQAKNIKDINIERVSGSLSDHFDPKNKVVRLSDSVYNETSVAAIGVSAHELGHVEQHKEGYKALVVRDKLIPVANIGSRFGPTMAILGLIFGAQSLMNVGIAFFAAAVVFYVLTLPVEFNASSRALVNLRDIGILNEEEIKKARKVLNAAALTYVASTAVAVANLARLIILANRRD